VRKYLIFLEGTSSLSEEKWWWSEKTTSNLLADAGREKVVLELYMYIISLSFADVISQEKWIKAKAKNEDRKEDCNSLSSFSPLFLNSFEVEFDLIIMYMVVMCSVLPF